MNQSPSKVGSGERLFAVSLGGSDRDSLRKLRKCIAESGGGTREVTIRQDSHTMTRRWNGIRCGRGQLLEKQTDEQEQQMGEQRVNVDEIVAEAASPKAQTGTQAGVVNTSAESELVSFVLRWKGGFVNQFVTSFRSFLFSTGLGFALVFAFVFVV